MTVPTIDQFHDEHGVMFVTIKRRGERSIHWHPERVREGRVERFARREDGAPGGAWYGAYATPLHSGWPSQRQAAEALVSHLEADAADEQQIGAST